MLHFALFLWTSFLAAPSTLLVPQSSLIETSLPLGEDDEIEIIQQLIEATEEQLYIQKELKKQMFELKKHREHFVQGNQTRTHATKLVRTARQVHELITSNHLEHLFSKEYLDELLFFSSIAGKSAITRP